MRTLSAPWRDSSRRLAHAVGQLRHRPFVLLATVLLLAALALQAAGLAHQLRHPVPDFNDNVLHAALINSMRHSLQAGTDPTDPWLGTIDEGYPLAHHYQHLPHLLLAWLGRLSGASTVTLLHASSLVLFVLLPLSVAVSVAWSGLGLLAALWAGILTTLVATNGLYGIDLSSFGWGGYGLTTQLWGLVLLAPAWVASQRALDARGSIVVAGVLLGALLLCHALLGWVGAVSTVLLAVVGLRHSAGWRGAGRRALRLGGIAAVSLLVTAYFVLPFFLDARVMNRSVWEPAGKYNAYGMAWTLAALMHGRLFDSSVHGWRPPVITVLVVAGAVLGIRRWRWQPALRPWVVLFGVWLGLYFGRPTWGHLLDLLPASRELQFHRLIVPMQLAGVVLGGVAVARLWRWAAGQPRLWRWGIVGVTCLALAPAVGERLAYGRLRRSWLVANERAFERDGGTAARAVETVKHAPAGRAYAGFATNWGQRYRVGAVPVYALLADYGVDNVGYLYHALSLNADIQGYFTLQRPALADLFDVRYVLAPATLAVPHWLQPMAAFGRHRVYVAPTTGYVELVDTGPVYAGPRRDWFSAAHRWLVSSQVEARRHPVFVLTGGIGGAGGLSASARPLSTARFAAAIDRGGRGQVLQQSAAPGRFTATVDVQRPCAAMIKVTYDPNWHARVDGRPVEPIMLAPAFVGVPLKVGHHSFVLIYRPRWWREPLRWLGLGLVGLLAVVVFWRRRGGLRRLVGLDGPM